MRMDKLTSKFQLALADAQSLAVGLDNQLIEPEHVMVALLDQEGGSIRHLLTRAGVKVNALRSQLGERLDDPLAMYLGDLFTVGANLAGIAGLSTPCGMTSAGLPIGLQIQGPAFAEERILRAAHMYQQATDWHRRRPELG